MENVNGHGQIPNHDIIGNGESRNWLYVLHGVFGAGRNWATVIRRTVERRPDWAALLVDLRQHGGSQGFLPPHTLAAAAADLRRLGEVTGRHARAVLGHSFGGKVALEYAAAGDAALAQVWVIDSTPDAGPPGGSAWHMLQVIRRLPDGFGSRDQAIQDLVANDVALPVAQWMASNLERTGNGFRWRFDIDALDELLRDFFRRDLWTVVESPPETMTIRFVRASESSILRPQAVARIERASSTGRVRLDTIEGGHWLNADNPDGIAALVADGLPTTR